MTVGELLRALRGIDEDLHDTPVVVLELGFQEDQAVVTPASLQRVRVVAEAVAGATSQRAVVQLIPSPEGSVLHEDLLAATAPLPAAQEG